MLELIEIKSEVEQEVKAMPPDKARFESHDTSPATDDVGNSPGNKYMGPERRREDRRQKTDRREDVRFDLKATDRRQKDGRRHNDAAPKFW